MSPWKKSGIGSATEFRFSDKSLLPATIERKPRNCVTAKTCESRYLAPASQHERTLCPEETLDDHMKRVLGRLGLESLLRSTAGAAIGILLVLLAYLFATVPMQIALVGLLVVVAGVRLRHSDTARIGSPLTVPLPIVQDRALFATYQVIADAFVGIGADKDPVYRGLALDRAADFAKQLHDIADGRILFTATETWRTAYGQLLRSPGLHLYRSVAHARTSTYWQDEPGQQSMQANYEMVGRGALSIERIVILPDHLWPANVRFPVEPLKEWIDDQYRHGICVKLVRQSVLGEEPDLVVDMGIYGARAVGFQEIDEHGRTVRFTLSFDFSEILAAEQRWERLSVYSVSYAKLLDRS